MFNRIRIGAGQRWVPDSRLFVVATAALLVCGSLNPRAVVVGDPVMEWNQIAVTRTLNAAPAQAPVQQTRTMAIVQVSIHDAINGIVGQSQTYSSPGPAPAGASPVAAAIAAAHYALRTLFEEHADSLDASYAASLAAHAVSPADPGIDFGRSVASGICCCARTTVRQRRNSGHRARRRKGGGLGAPRRGRSAVARLGRRDSLCPEEWFAVPARWSSGLD